MKRSTLFAAAAGVVAALTLAGVALAAGDDKPVSGPRVTVTSPAWSATDDDNGLRGDGSIDDDGSVGGLRGDGSVDDDDPHKGGGSHRGGSGSGDDRGGHGSDGRGGHGSDDSGDDRGGHGRDDRGGDDRGGHGRDD